MEALGTRTTERLELPPQEPDKPELTRATKKEVREEGRGSPGTEEVRMLCGPPGTY